MNDNDIDTVSAKITDRIMAAVHIAERLKGIEVQANRTAADLDSEKATRARVNEKVDSKLDGLQTQVGLLSKSNWTAGGAIIAAFMLWDVIKHFIKF